MSNMDTLISNIKPNSRSITKEELQNFINESLRQIGEINEAYKKAFEGSTEQSGLLVEIEEKLKQIKIKYEEYFIVISDNGKTKVTNLDEKIQGIIDYHKILIEGDNSIKKDIEKSRENIMDFYNYLFVSESEDVNKDTQVKNAIERIVNFDDKVQSDTGYKKSIEDAHSIIIAKYEELFRQKDENEKTKIEGLDQSIYEIGVFHQKVKEEIDPFLKDIQIEITGKKDEVNALLSGATGGSLIQGYLKSKNEYRQIPEYKSLEGTLSQKLISFISNIALFLTNVFRIIFEYTLFILPLIIAVAIFVRPDLVPKVVDSQGRLEDYFKNLDFFSRLTISLPLWWISWFGQRSISHNRRLSEEYNHKAQVAKMYLNFSSRETQGAYPISEKAKNDLDSVLIKAIERHPGEVLGRDETILDKVLQIVKASRGIVDNEYSNIKNSLLKEEQTKNSE